MIRKSVSVGLCSKTKRNVHFSVNAKNKNKKEQKSPDSPVSKLILACNWKILFNWAAKPHKYKNSAKV